MPQAKENETLYCQFCRGEGRYGLNLKEICPVCYGVGKFLALARWIWCSTCHGSGKDSRSDFANNRTNFQNDVLVVVEEAG